MFDFNASVAMPRRCLPHLSHLELQRYTRSHSIHGLPTLSYDAGVQELAAKVRVVLLGTPLIDRSSSV